MMLLVVSFSQKVQWIYSSDKTTNHIFPCSDGCIWYAQGENCAYYGDQFAGEFGTANQACCACGGGLASKPAEGPPEDPGCSNNPSNWVDSEGDDCSFYAEGSNCVDFGDLYADNNGITAKQACCVCGGGLNNKSDGPAPAPAPGPPPPVSEPQTCFSERSEILVDGKGLMRMDALQIGDSVQIADGTFSKVYSFGHKASTQRTKYLQVFSASMDKGRPLEISPEHLIYTRDTSKKTWKLVPAGDLNAGDSLLSANERPSTILWIREIERNGAYAPLTLSGNLLVNGVLTSSYVSRNWLKDHVSGLTLHKFQHGGMLPVRLFCSLVSCQEETYHESTGFSAWVQFWYEIEQWMLTLPLAWQVCLWPLLLVPATLIALWGQVSVQPISSLVTNAVAVIMGYFLWKRQTLKETVSCNRSAEMSGKGVAT